MSTEEAAEATLLSGIPDWVGLIFGLLIVVAFAASFAKKAREKDKSSKAGKAEDSDSQLQQAVSGMKSNWQLIALAVIGLALFFILFDQIEAVLAWLGIGWTTLFVLIGVIVLFMGAKHYRAAGNSIAAGGFYAVAILVAAGFTYQLLADEQLPFVKAAEVPTGKDWDIVSFEPGTEVTFRARRSIAAPTSGLSLAYACSWDDPMHDVEIDDHGPYLVITPKDGMFAGGVTEVKAFILPWFNPNNPEEVRAHVALARSYQAQAAC